MKINLPDGKRVGYTITADLDEAVKRTNGAIPKGRWELLLNRDGFKMGREVTETVHMMENFDHAFRLAVRREQVEDPSLFAETNEDFYR